jgi:hypothetical protein
MNKKYKYIFSLRLAGYCMMRGNRILRINHNLNIPDKDVYVFESTDELIQAMIDYKNAKEK